MKAFKKFTELSKKYNIVKLDELLTSSNPKNISIILDDGHISIKKILTSNKNIYVSIIGRCVDPLLINTSYQNTNMPTPIMNLQAAHFYSLKGNNKAFLSLNEIPIEQRLNHTYTHRRISISNKQITTFNIHEPYYWHIAVENILDDNVHGKPIYEFMHYHLLEKYTQIEIESMYSYLSEINKQYVVCPFNAINKSFINICKNINTRYIIHHKVFDVCQQEELNIERICID